MGMPHILELSLVNQKLQVMHQENFLVFGTLHCSADVHMLFHFQSADKKFVSEVGFRINH
jgi:hypothetical protein